MADPAQLGFAMSMNGMTTVEDDRQLCIVVRHGQTNWNKEGRVQGQLDFSRLLEKGEHQARCVGRAVRNVAFDAVFSSPLSRAKRTTQLVLEEIELPAEAAPVTFLNELMEINLPWEGMLKKEIKDKFPEYEVYQTEPHEFSYNDFAPVLDLRDKTERVWEHVRSARKRVNLLVAHNQTNRALLTTALKLPAHRHHAFSQENCCINVLQREGDNFELLCSNICVDGAKVPQETPPPDMFRLELREGYEEQQVFLDGVELDAASSKTPEELVDTFAASAANHVLVTGRGMTSLLQEAMETSVLSLGQGGMASVLIARSRVNGRPFPQLEVLVADDTILDQVLHSHSVSDPFAGA